MAPILPLDFETYFKCIGHPIQRNWQLWKGYTPDMARIIRSAMLQMRVAPEIKLASEHVLRRIGLNITEATELFLRRMIIDERLPFDIVAFDNATYTQLVLDWEDESRIITMQRGRTTTPPSHKKKIRAKRE